ncbi:hypothetical protein HETIRDRAFT_166016 [Heterobasidion irregulare TC 32-1]|uniref:Uncharacterized protein n=1 Tax=Heterobasidion irregulare (strain TC 32-1) TaxID=747525 RepID=W4KM99_HETIT|nr:uncharacterized protein HETIRDRAFT_166016 [Heterobasidion irregulare TC 32-1]ETW86505.1 hypothetical protein HETIRDRAFT_166016 [Heterobasidion irregulare TC 32-1]
MPIRPSCPKPLMGGTIATVSHTVVGIGKNIVREHILNIHLTNMTATNYPQYLFKLLSPPWLP